MDLQNKMDFHVTLTQELVSAFSRFSGDFGSLHTNAEFGRRSMYNSTIVHGVLPLLFLPLALARVSSTSFARVLKIEAQFQKPLFVGDEISIEFAPFPAFENSTEIDFSIRRTATHAVVTRGHMVLEISLDADFIQPDLSVQGASLTPEVLSEQNHFFENIEKGHISSLNFRWGPTQRRAYFAILSTVLTDVPFINLMTLGNCGTLALLSMISALVGMVMPGQPAVFQSFSLINDLGLQNGVTAVHMHACVSHKSVATNVITQEFKFSSGKRNLAHGKFSVLVAKRSFVPPTVEELAEGFRDLGLRNKVVLITGASRGLGATTAKMFAIHGATVVVNYRSSQNEAQAIVCEIEAYGGKAMAIQADVSIEGNVRQLVSQVLETYGTIDVLVNNAASNFYQVPFLETSWKKIQEDIDTIVKGAFLVSQAVLPTFLLNGSGKVINVTSLATEMPPPFQTRFVVAKSALVGMTRAMAVEFAEQNIQVNMVVPSLVETDFSKSYNQIALSKFKSLSPMKVLASVHDVANAIVFMASPRSKFTTGQKFMVTGGLPPFL